jgi:hypothetical protein
VDGVTTAREGVVAHFVGSLDRDQTIVLCSIVAARTDHSGPGYARPGVA